MTWLVLCSFLGFGFGQLFKWSQRRGCDAPAVVTINYGVVGILLLANEMIRGGLNLTAPIVAIGLLTGLSFIVAMLLMTRAMEVANVAVVLTAFRLSILVPILADLLIWGEEVSRTQMAGIMIALAALVLMTRGHGQDGRSRWRDLGLALLIFLTQGISQSCMHWVHYAGLDESRLQVLFITVTTAAVLGGIAMMARRRRPTCGDVRMGMGIGVFNLAALATILTALTLIDGTIFFPVTGCAVVILDNLFAHFFWKEKLKLLVAIGAGSGAFSMLLVL